MKQFIAYLLLGALLGVIPPPVSAQQNHSPQHTAQEIEALKNRVAELEKQLQTVENVEKLELARNYTDAQAKLLNAEFGRFERELRDFNDEWLRNWGIITLSILALFGAGALIWVKSRTNQLIANAVEKNLDGFKGALKEQNTIKNELVELAKVHAASVLLHIDYSSVDDEFYSGEIKVLTEGSLLPLFQDENFAVDIRCKAAKVLAIRKSPRLVAPFLEFLNSVVYSDLGIEEVPARQYLRHFSTLLGRIPTLEAFEGLTLFLKRLLKDNPRHKNLFLNGTAFALSDIGLQLNRGSSVTILRKAIPALNLPGEHDGPIMIVRYFERYNEPDAIKEILTNHAKDLSSGVEDKCLELLEKHGPKFVEEWRAGKASDGAEA